MEKIHLTLDHLDPLQLLDYNLFDNPMVRSARSSMTKEDLERYQDWGHAVFDDIDYETGN